MRYSVTFEMQVEAGSVGEALTLARARVDERAMRPLSIAAVSGSRAWGQLPTMPRARVDLVPESDTTPETRWEARAQGRNGNDLALVFQAGGIVPGGVAIWNRSCGTSERMVLSLDQVGAFVDQVAGFPRRLISQMGGALCRR